MWKLAVVNLDKRPLLEFQTGEHEESDLVRFSHLPDLTLEEAIAAK